MLSGHPMDRRTRLTLLVVAAAVILWMVASVADCPADTACDGSGIRICQVLAGCRGRPVPPPPALPSGPSIAV
jgi:hypothetical protein